MTHVPREFCIPPGADPDPAYIYSHTSMTHAAFCYFSPAQMKQLVSSTAVTSLQSIHVVQCRGLQHFRKGLIEKAIGAPMWFPASIW